MQMKARSHNGGFAFPGYDGFFPRASRSSRVRAEGMRKPRNLSKGTNVFELLATVAGQLLQDANKGEGNTGNQPADCRLTDEEYGAKEVRATSDLNQALSENQLGALLCALDKGDEVVTSKDLGDKEDIAISNSGVQECSARKVSEPQVTESYRTEVEAKCLHKSNFVQESSVRVPTTVNALGMKGECTNEIAPVTCITRGTISFAQEGLLPTTSLRAVDDAASSEMGIDKPEVSIRLNNEIQHDEIWAFQAEVAKTKLGSSVNDPKGFCLGDGPNCHNFGLWIKEEVQDRVVLDDDTPPLVSSGSSGEDPLYMQDKPYGMHFGIPTQKWSEKQQEVRCSNVKDSDNNSSESAISETALEKPLRICQTKTTKGRKLARSTDKNKVQGAGVKRKHVELEEAIRRESGDSIESRMASRVNMVWVPYKQKVVEGCSYETPNLLMNTDDASSLEYSSVDGEPPASAAKLRSAKVASVASSPTSTGSPFKMPSKKLAEPHVNLRINSFTVPELSVDVPESATIANLKRAVMEAAMNVLGGGLHVRVLLQGKKILDESASLLEVGRSCNGKLDSLGFMLEPNLTANPPTNAEDPVLLLSHADSQLVTRYPVFSMGNEVNPSTIKRHTGKAKWITDADIAINTAIREQVDNINQNGTDLDVSMNASCSGPLIVHPGMGAEGVQELALVPMQEKSQNSEVGKRRMRTPFTVAEVEALVQAVEKLGIGRWRDVKLCAFDQAKHRTYVDLKDKWKTLAHTARLAPHQRRGEPVPQELLDRVIQAHTYWTAQHANQAVELEF